MNNLFNKNTTEKIKAIIFLNGKYKYEEQFISNLINEKDIIFCADGGADYAYKYGIFPEYIIGDLDSIDTDVLQFYKKEEKTIIERYNPEKDYTDFELILKKVENYEQEKNIKFENIYVLGGLGKRYDMTLNNLHMMEKHKNLTFFSENEEIFYREKSFSLMGKKGVRFSIIPIDNEIKSLTLEGFKYEIKNVNIERSASRLVSNEIICNKCNISFEKGKMFVVLF